MANGEEELQKLPSLAPASLVSNNDAMFREPVLPPDVALPPNGGDLGSLITQETLGQFTPEGATPEEIASIQASINAQVPSAEIGDPGASLFPGISQPINVGQQSGQIIGSQPIFVQRGGAFPAGVVQAREKALDDAAKARAKALKPFDLPKGPTVQDPRFQKSLNQAVVNTQENFIARAGTEFGEELKFAALQDPKTKIGIEFTQAMDNLDVLARESDQIIELFADVDSGLESGDLVFSDETIALRKEFETLTGAVEGGDIQNLGNMRDKLNTLQGSISLDKFLNDNKTIEKIKGTIVQRAGVKDFDEFMGVRTTKTKEFDQAIEQLSSDFKRDQFKGSPLSKEDIANHLKGILGSEKVSSLKISAKPKAAQVSVKVEDVNKTQGAPNVVKLNTTDAQGNATTFNMTSTVRNNFPTDGKAINAVGLKRINSSGQVEELQAGIGDIKLVTSQDATYTDASGNTVTKPVVIARSTKTVKVDPLEGLSDLERQAAIVSDPDAGKLVDKEITEDIPLLFDESMEQRMETDRGSLKIGKGVAGEMRKAATGTKPTGGSLDNL